MTERIKVGVIGCRVGRTWVAGAQAGAATTAWAVADLNQDLARKTAAEHDVARVYGDYRELLADGEVDGRQVGGGRDRFDKLRQSAEGTIAQKVESVIEHKAGVVISSK